MTVFLLILGLVFLGLCVTALIRLATLRRLKTAERLGAIEEYGFSPESAPLAIPTTTQRAGLTRYVASLGELVGQCRRAVRQPGCSSLTSPCGAGAAIILTQSGTPRVAGGQL